MELFVWYFGDIIAHSLFIGLLWGGCKLLSYLQSKGYFQFLVENGGNDD